LADVLAWAEANYDQVLIDCPPILAAADAAIIGRLTEGLLLVIQPEKNHRRLVLRAVGGLASIGVGLIGIVANRIRNPQVGGYYGYGGYGYGYRDGYRDPSADSDEVDESELAHEAMDWSDDHDAGPAGTQPRRRAA
jgi:polysaccharide biosynthesis transport protein